MSEADDDDIRAEPDGDGGSDSVEDAFDGLLGIFEARSMESQVTRKIAGSTPPSGKNLQQETRQFIPGTIIAQRYRIVSLIGRGGMGEVYQAEDLTIGETVALKFLPRELVQDPIRLEALYNEVRHGRRVTHPNVCRVHDIAEMDGRHFLSMEFIDGEDLGQLLRRIGKLPRDKVVQLARQLCAGLAAAHQQGVLHLDLKPANLMIDGRGNLHITDFGLAKLSGEIRDAADPIIGTPPYMAPEQLRVGETSVQSDIYALGLIISEMLTGIAIQRGDDGIEEIVRRHDSTSPAQLASRAVEMDEPEITNVILASLERDPAKRPNSVAEVAARLPGRPDALAEALAAGETPDPELVAAAGEHGTLSPGIGLALLLGCLMVIVATAILKDPSQSSETVKSAEVLEAEAMALLRDTGAPQNQYRKYGLDRDEAGKIYFWYRESPQALFPEKGLRRRVTETDPSPSEPGMLSTRLDLQGEQTSGARAKYPVDWEMWLWVLVVTVSIVLAIHHVRQGRADRRGALVVATGIALFAFIHWMIGLSPSLFHNRPDVFFRAIQGVFSVTLGSAIFYLALEPVMRRVWPQTLIAWSRLLSGRWRDPLVGQSLLIGVLAGALNVLILNLGKWTPVWLGSTPYTERPAPWYALANDEPALSILFSSGQQAIFYAFGIGVVVAVFAARFPRRRIACTLAILFLSVFQINSLGGEWQGMPFLLVSTTALILVLVHIGVLSLIVSVWTLLILRSLPFLTIYDGDAELLASSAILIIALVGYWICSKQRGLGDQSARQRLG